MKKIIPHLFIFLVLVVIATQVSARPSISPNNNNVPSPIDSLEGQRIKFGEQTEGGLSVEDFASILAARFDGQVFIDSFITGISPGMPDVFVGEDENRVPTRIQGDAIAGNDLRATNLENTSLRRVCRDPDGVLILCASQAPVDVCPNIEGAQTTLQTELFVLQGGNCVRPTPPAAAPLATPEPTIEVRFVRLNEKQKMQWLPSELWPLSRIAVDRYTVLYRINFGTPLQQQLSFNAGFCTNHNSANTLLDLCKGIPYSFRGQLVATESMRTAPWPNSLIHPYNWSGHHPSCAGTQSNLFPGSACTPALRGPVDAREFGRFDITLPAGTVDTGWIVHSYKGSRQEFRETINKTWYFYDLINGRGRNRFNNTLDLTNVYFFNISDPENRFNPTNLKNLTKPGYGLNWVRTGQY